MAAPAVPSSGATSRASENSEFVEALSEFRMMLRYANAEGLTLDDATQRLAASVQQGFIAKIAMPEGGPAPQGVLTFDQVMAAHAALAKVIAPATPLSLRATEPAPGFLGSLRRPPLVLWMIVLAVVSAFGFVATSVWFPDAAAHPGAEKVIWCFAAALGAVFYVLFTVHTYVKDRTFDPRYNPLYVIRFVLGILAGLILAIVLQRNTTAGVKDLGPAVVALLGGFSTEAVYQILQRLVEVLVTAVRGDGSDAAQQKASEAARKDFLALADEPGIPDQLKSKLLAAAKRVGA